MTNSRWSDEEWAARGLRRVRYTERSLDGLVHVVCAYPDRYPDYNTFKYTMFSIDFYTEQDPRPQWLQTAAMIANAGQHGAETRSIIGNYWTVWFDIDGDDNVVEFF